MKWNNAGGESTVPLEWKIFPQFPLKGKIKSHITSHITKTLERLLLCHLRLQAQQAHYSLHFSYQEQVVVEDAVLYMLHMLTPASMNQAVMLRLCSLTFQAHSTSFSTTYWDWSLVRYEWLPPSLHGLWANDHSLVRLGNCVSGTLKSSIWTPQGTGIGLYLFTQYTADFNSNSESRHAQKYSNNTVIVACERSGAWGGVQGLGGGHQRLEREKQPSIEHIQDQPASIQGNNIEVVKTYKYRGVHLDNKLDWLVYVDVIYGKGQSRCFSTGGLGPLRPVGGCCRCLISQWRLTPFYVAVCREGGNHNRSGRQTAEQAGQEGWVGWEGARLHLGLWWTGACWASSAIMDNINHPLHHILAEQESSCSGRFICLRLRTEWHRSSFIPTHIWLYISGEGKGSEKWCHWPLKPHMDSVYLYILFD